MSFKKVVSVGIGIACGAHVGLARAQTCYVLASETSCTNTHNVHGTLANWVIAGGTYNTNDADNSTIAGGWYNTIDEYCSYSTIAGGASSILSYTTWGETYGFIGGGVDNLLQVVQGSGAATASYNVIVGGNQNAITGSWASFIGGGAYNSIGSTTTTGGNYATILGGASNTVTTNGGGAFIGGGASNKVDGTNSSIAGGEDNTASGYGGTIFGGQSNSTNGNQSTAAGGNTAATGYWSLVMGQDSLASGTASLAIGETNEATGTLSMAVGRNAQANESYCFVWSDAVVPTLGCELYGTGGGLTSNVFVVGSTNGAEFVTGYSGGTYSGVYIGANQGAWNNLSDRNAKKGFESVDTRDVLEHVLALPITTWRYNGERRGVAHMGPMAQDFYAAFHLGDDDRHISTIDPDGVVLAAIQGLHGEVVRKDEAIASLSAGVATLEKVNVDVNQRLASLAEASAAESRRVASLEKQLAAIEARMGLGR
jgi:trimeric autotransporter adhesin